ncbi:nop14 [Anaeramoeba flamelloides]|uniref:Nop14 n=1 Tax=Anaeramoeba flamelloides TaxID=1746091 RepID=A0ABQ8XAU2_9EUKA|nr:nop14 [Anaeramoeba flamelloides]
MSKVNRFNQKKKRNVTKKENPFNLRHNKRKFKVYGQEHKPINEVQNRQRSHQTRQKTLLKEYKTRNKSNRFNDRRIGEYDSKLTKEEKMFLRFQKQRSNSSRKRNIFNLEQTNVQPNLTRVRSNQDVLTHKGVSLFKLGDEISKHPKLKKEFTNDHIGLIKEENDEDKVEGEGEDYFKDNTGQIDSRIVSEYHFGGGDLQIGNESLLDGSNGENDLKFKKSRKDILAEIVEKSVLYREQKKKEKILDQEFQNKIDEEFNELMDEEILIKKQEREPNVDAYETMVTEMTFDTRYRAFEESNYQGNLEDRKHNYLELLNEKNERKKIQKNDQKNIDQILNIQARIKRLKKKHHNIILDIENSSIVRLTDDDIPIEYELRKKALKIKNQSQNNTETISRPIETIDILSSEAGLQNYLKTKDIPKRYLQFTELIKGKKIEEQIEITENMHRMIYSSNNLNNDIRGKLELFFIILMTHFKTLCQSDDNENIQIINKFHAPIISITRKIQPFAAAYFKIQIENLYKKYNDLKSKSNLINFNLTLIEIKHIELISILYPNTDFRHPIITPTLLLLNRFISEIPIKDFKMLYLLTFVAYLLVFKFYNKSKRFSPELITFLNFILKSAKLNLGKGSNDKDDDIKQEEEEEEEEGGDNDNYIPCQNNINFELYNDNLKKVTPTKIVIDVILKGENNQQNKINCLSLVFRIIESLIAYFQEYPSSVEIFQNFYNLINLLDNTNIEPLKTRLNKCKLKNIQNLEIMRIKVLSRLKIIINKRSKFRKKMVNQTRTPSKIILLDPKFEDSENFGMSHEEILEKRAKKKIKKMKSKLKKEKRGAIREIRKDNQFLADVQLKENKMKIKDDQERNKRFQGMLNKQQTQWRDLWRSGVAKDKKK